MYERVKLIRVSRMGKHLVVEIAYKDNKTATYSVDRGKLKDKQLLEATFESIFRQIESSGVA